ncbi:hypothetical protein K432DRAFT_404058 [Lepidopterella palustris CBS 459.81]|uniref:Uncharacterized protein n=1 Tax=Lepidopterella palustris CBS 459.81 TaxID=1314670 RepID=A0A8E2EC09_9PEZI|nr:hypothetical protein K432DRAFT_404058 [Lepidopterella palustris CBS 459.81]
MLCIQAYRYLQRTFPREAVTILLLCWPIEILGILTLMALNIFTIVQTAGSFRLWSIFNLSWWTTLICFFTILADGCTSSFSRGARDLIFATLLVPGFAGGMLAVHAHDPRLEKFQPVLQPVIWSMLLSTW